MGKRRKPSSPFDGAAASIRKKPRLTQTPLFSNPHVSSHTKTKTKTMKEEHAGEGLTLEIYDYVQETLTIMKHLETHVNDNKAKSRLTNLHFKIRLSTDYHKSTEELPDDWIFDPATAHTLVLKEETSSQSEWCLGPPLAADDDREFHADDITLKGEDMNIWIDFKISVKDVPENKFISLNHFEELKTPLIHPIVDVLGQFSVSAYNKACHMYFKKDIPENLQDYHIMECKYIKLIKRFFFYLTIEAVEEGVLGVYEVKVMSDCEDRITLNRLVLTDRTPAGKKPEKHYLTTNPDVWADPEDDFYSGLVSRDERDTSKGFDYYSPFGFFGP